MFSNPRGGEDSARLIGAGCAIVGAGVGTLWVSGSLVIGMARNPHLEATLFRYTVVGFALSEAMGLLSPYGRLCSFGAFLGIRTGQLAGAPSFANSGTFWPGCPKRGFSFCLAPLSSLAGGYPRSMFSNLPKPVGLRSRCWGKPHS